MTINEAIKKAEENGYDHIAHYDGEWSYEQIFLDPLFWQSLGKALGWAPIGSMCYWEKELNDWSTQWHRFIDHLAEGKDVESFFTHLTK